MRRSMSMGRSRDKNPLWVGIVEYKAQFSQNSPHSSHCSFMADIFKATAKSQKILIFFIYLMGWVSNNEESTTESIMKEWSIYSLIAEHYNHLAKNAKLGPGI